MKMSPAHVDGLFWTTAALPPSESRPPDAARFERTCISPVALLRIQVQEFRGRRGGKREVAFVKSAQAHQSFPPSGSNDLLLSGVLLPGPHRCADEVFANLPSDVGLP